MRYLLLMIGLFLCETARAGDTEPDNPILIGYRDYRGVHKVIGYTLSDNVFVYNREAEKQLTLATLDWSPYIGKDICRQGWVMQAAVALLHSIGYGATVTFYPWARAVAQVESGKSDILFPEYFIEPEAPSDVYPGTRRLDHLILSAPFGWGPIAFIKRKGYDTSHYKGLESLQDERIGVVRGYQNTPEFDRLMDKGAFNIVSAIDDLTNVKLLLSNRVNLIIGDPDVIRAEVSRSSMPEQTKERFLAEIQVVEPILKMNALYFAVSKHKSGVSSLLFELDTAIASFKNQGVMDEIKYQVHRSCDEPTRSQ